MQIELTYTNGEHLHYLLHIPPNSEDGFHPLILFLHGAGERGDDLSMLKKHGIPKIVEQDQNFPFITVSPQCPIGSWWTEKVEVLKGLLDQVVTSYPIDSGRLYLTGLSMGGYGSWALATAYPEVFAAAAPICGRGNPSQAGRIKDLPLWVFHGDRDIVVPFQHSQDMVMALKAVGSRVRFTLYPDTGHDSWTQTYDNPDLYQWFLKHCSR